MAPDTAHLVAAILNDWWMVRHYARGGRMNPTSALSAKRSQAIQKLGLTVRNAFNTSEDFEPLLAAVVNGGSSRDEQPF